MKKKLKIILILILFNFSLNAQHFDKVEAIHIDSFNTLKGDYLVDIEFKLIEQFNTLLIRESGCNDVLIRFDSIEWKRNGAYLLLNDKPDYFIINPEFVLHHREYKTDKGTVIIRNKYTKQLIRI